MPALPMAIPSGGSEAERAAGILRSRLAYARVEEIFEPGLHQYLLDLQRSCYRLGEHIQAEYFAPRVLRPEDVVA